MKNFVVLDTELTGLDIDGDDRIISIGIVELFNECVSGREMLWFMNPKKRSHPEAYKIHGLSQTFLSTQPVFEDVAQEIINFIGGSTIIHHCYYRDEDDKSVDERAVNKELSLAGYEIFPHKSWLNIKKWAQDISPEKNSLDHMLKRFSIDLGDRAKRHDALEDAQLTAALYKKYQENYPQFRQS